MTIGTCKHGRFDLEEGCPKCIEERCGDEKKVTLQFKVTAPPGAPVGEEEKVAGEIIQLAETISEVLGKEKPTALILRPGEDVEARSYFEQAQRLLVYAEGRVIITLEDNKAASDDLTIISKVKKGMSEKRKEYLDPILGQAEAIRETYNYLMSPVLEADKITRQKMLDYRVEQERKRSEAEAIEAEKLELARREAELKGGEITIDLTPIGKPEAVPNVIRTEMGSSGQRDNWQWEVTDINQVPREYLMINAGMLTPIVKASKGKIVIPGITISNKPIIAVNAR